MTSPVASAKTISTDEIHFIPIGNDETACRLFVNGNKNAKDVILFCPGYPDDCSAMLPLAKRLAKDHDCLTGVTCVPGYDSHKTDYNYRKFTLNQCVDVIRQGFKILKDDISSHAAPTISGIFHDWGCFFGCMYINRDADYTTNTIPVSQIVLLDILPNPHRSTNVIYRPTIYEGFVMMYYFHLLALTYLLTNFVSFYLTLLLGVITVPTGKFLQLFPIQQIDFDTAAEINQHKKNLKVLSLMSYTYYLFLKALYTKNRSDLKGSYMPPPDKIPILFLHGSAKNIMYYFEGSINLLKNANNKSNAIEIDNAGHWLHIQQPEIVLKHISMFLFGSEESSKK